MKNRSYTAVLAVAIAERLGWSDEDLRALRMAVDDGNYASEVAQLAQAVAEGRLTDNYAPHLTAALAEVINLIQPVGT